MHTQTVLCFAWAAYLSHTSCIKRGNSRSALRTPRSKLHTLPFKLNKPRSKLHTPRTELYPPRSKLHTPRTELYPPRSKLHTLRSKLSTPRTVFRTTRSKLYGLLSPVPRASEPHTPRSELRITRFNHRKDRGRVRPGTSVS